MDIFAALARTKGDIKIASDQNLDGYLSVLFPFRSELQGYWKTVLTLHATSFLSDIFTKPPMKMLPPSARSFQPIKRHCSATGKGLDGTSPYPGCLHIANTAFMRLFPGNDK